MAGLAGLGSVRAGKGDHVLKLQVSLEIEGFYSMPYERVDYV